MKHPVSSVGSCTPGSATRSAMHRKINQVTMSFSNLHLETSGAEEKISRTKGIVQCTYCCLSFQDVVELRAHCQTESHQTIIMSDEGRDWKYRPPPRGLTSDAYRLCENWCIGGGTCRYEVQCVDAHGPDELAEWQERFEYRRMKMQRACEKELFGKSYAEQLLERWIQAANPENVMREKLHDVEENCSGELMKMVSSKVSSQEWKFTLRTCRLFRAVALLQDTHRNHFFLKSVSSHDMEGKTLFVWEPTNANESQEWDATNFPLLLGTNSPLQCDSLSVIEHTVEVSFTTDIYGTFRQSVVFDFGSEPVLVRHLCVDVVPVTDVDRIKELHKEYVLSGSERWDKLNTHIVKYTSNFTPIVSLLNYVNEERELDLLNAYPTPQADTFTLTQSTVVEKKLTRNNYRARMHELLYVEEMAQYDQVAQYNLVCRLQLVNCYLLAPNGPSNSTAKYSNSGELFAVMNLEKDVSEDTTSGRLILNNCTTVLLSTDNSRSTDIGERNEIPVAYEALIEDKGKNTVYLRLSATCVESLQLKPDTELVAEVQFQLNRIPYCEWHYAVDKIADYKLVFPDTFLEPNIPWTPLRQWSEILDPRLNLKQKEAVVAITTPVTCFLPPILIIGPYGTGKTYTLAQAIKQLLLQPHSTVLVCTHSNSAADLYIKDYLHPYVEEGHEYARPLRIYYHKRWVATVNAVVQKYCLIDITGGVKSFRIPTIEDIKKHRVIVTTLSTSMYLSSLGLQRGFFSHILLDEAAQVMECEAIMPLALADEKTRIVLAGDHMQLSPELFSHFAKERYLHVSLLERLYDHYPATFPCKILLCENYRAHEAIIQFTSELFYEQKLISSGKQPRHENFYPLTFFTTRGEDIQDVNSTAFYNNSEVYEVVERVLELRKKWPSSWGKIDDQSIGIMTPYSAQVFRIRSELRKRRLGGISVERVLNVQGKQFRAVFLSTVRTHRTCHPRSRSSMEVEDMDYGFLSNSKLLNTAITRAQSLVAVIGDPVALCSIGRCRKVWERFIEICNDNTSFFGMTWSCLRSQLDGVELKKTYVLNPLAPEFVPRQYQLESYIHIPSQFAVDCNTSLMAFAQTPQGEVPLPFPPGSEPSLSSCIPHPTHVPRPTHMPPPPALHLPPNFPTTNAAPVIFYTGSPVPPVHPPLPMSGPNSNFYPLKTALGTLSLVNSPPLLYNSVVPSSITPLNSWGNPLISPSILRGNPQWGQTMHGDFLKKSGQTAPQIATVFPLPYYEAQRGGLNSPTRTNGLPNVNGHLGPPQSSLSASHNSVADCYIPGGVMSPAVLSQCSPSSDTVCTSTNGVADKVEQIQFLHNVHFPEKLVHAKEKRHKEITTVLPPEVSLSQLFNSEAQREWYNHVLETSGLETANKLMEMVLSDTAETMKPPTPTSPSQECFHPHIVQGLEDLFIDKKLSNTGPVVDHRAETNNIQRHHVLSQLNILQHTRQQKIPGDTNNIQAGVILHENELRTYLTAVSRHELVVNDVLSIKCSENATENFHLVEENNPAPVQQETRTDFASCNSIGDISKQSWPPLPSHNSIAAYPSHNSSSTISSEGVVSTVNDFLDGVVDKTSTAGSGAFAGYARAVSIGFQHYNESTFYSSTHFQPQRLNQQLLSNYPHSVVQQDTISFHSSIECNSEEDHINCTFPLNRTVRNENTSGVLRTIRTDPSQSNGRKEYGGKMEDPYTSLHSSEPKTAHQGSRLYQYFS